ncbi:MAG: hypothetical protein ACK5PB_05025 [Pirellula sp.]|jgi:hypothetical protein
MWSEFVFVRVSIWIASGLWFLGSAARAISRGQPSQLERAYQWIWFFTGIFTWTHVLASYGLIHNWSHANVLQHTGEESYAVIGIRVPWGVYANFVFAGVLSGYSGWMILRNRRASWADSIVFLFLAFIVFNALVIFKTGPIRWIGLIGFVALFSIHIHSQGSKFRGSSIEETSRPGHTCG